MPRSDPPDLYRELFELSADAILIIEGDAFVDCNPAAVEMLRYGTKEEVLRAHPSALSPPHQPDGRPSFEKANEMIALAFERGSHRFEWDHLRADGEVFPVEVLLTAMSRRDGGPILHTVWRDITERKRLEGELRQSLKMEAIGKLAGGIAHDFNNLLVGILGYADLLLDRLERPEDRQAAEQILGAGERAASLVRQLMLFSRKQELMPQVVSLCGVLTEIERLLGRIIGEHIDLRFERCAAPVWVQVDPSQLEQVVVNLAANARDAMPEGGILQVRVARSDAPEGLPAGRYAMLEVQDTGRGMDAQTARRAFEPFFTTKPQGSGTGLGLATVYGVAQQAGGTVTLASGPAGTTVRVYLPEIEAELPVRSPPPSTASKDGGDETILLVEDEATVAALVLGVLERKGYRVLLARDGVEALALWEQEPTGSIDLLLTDVVMPRMGGLALARALEQTGHAPPVLFMSGYTSDHLDGARDGPIDLVEKPFIVRQLLLRVRRAIDKLPALGGDP